jgi:hypothetical protein
MESLLVPFITVLVEGIKRSGKVDKAWLPIIAVVMGAAVGFVPEMSFEGLMRGAVAGGAAVGLYEVIKSGSATVRKML